MLRDRIRLVSVVLAACLVSLPLLAAGPGERLAERAALIAQYDALAPLTETQRKDAYSVLTPDVQSALWVVHLERFLVDHPELTAQQRGVIYEGIGMLRAGLFERLYSSDAARVAAATEDLNQFSIRAKSLLSHELTDLAFNTIGRGKPAAEPVDPMAGRWKVAGNPLPYCTCSVQDDYCWEGGCVYRTNSCRFTTGCGTFFQYGCDGLCY